MKFIKSLLAVTMLAGSVSAAEPATPVNADPALWVVKDDDTTVYLFGTIHVLKPEIAWFDGGVRNAYQASKEVVIEMIEPTPEEAQRIVMAKAIDPDGPALPAKLGAEQRKAFEAALTGFGLPAASFDQFMPWFAATALANLAIAKAGYSGASGVDKQIAASAKQDGKTVTALETVAEQIGIFDTIPETAQIAFLNVAVADLPVTQAYVSRMAHLWATGDPDGLATLMSQMPAAVPELYARIFPERNARWADWIAKRMEQPGTVFMAVGAGHLAGKDSVQALLKAKRIVAVRIPS